MMPMRAFRAACLTFLIGVLPMGTAMAGTIEGPQGNAGEAPVAPLPKLHIDSIRADAVRSIPYPNGGLYVDHGIAGAFLFGKRGVVGENTLFQWQGELSYFYSPNFSGGLSFRIIAGEPTDTKQTIINRYFVHARFHKAWEKVAIFAGPQIGAANINILTDSLGKKKVFEPLKNTKPTLALDLGGGWRFSRFFGATLGANAEYSFVDEVDVGTTNAINLHISPGVSLDIIALTENLKHLVPAFFVYAEFQTGFLISQDRGQRQDQAYMMGLGLAF